MWRVGTSAEGSNKKGEKVYEQRKNEKSSCTYTAGREGENTEKGTLFLCLLRKFFPHLPLQRNFQYAKKVQKKNAAILRRFNHFMQTKTRELYSPVLSLLASSMPFAVADMIFKSVSLIVSSMVSS